ncbi:MAG: DUF3237 domain-containing protein [Alphaproteobacteria bacterium]
MSEIELPELRGEHLFTAKFDVATPTVLENTPYGTRIIAGINGGSFEGPKMNGSVAPIPAGDWILIRNDGAWQMDVRLTLVTDDDHHIFMTYRGVRHGPKEVLDRLSKGEPVDPSEYYFRNTPWFETGSEKYGWLNRIVAVATGHRFPEGPTYKVYEIL